ncbi:hypothetical protein A0256_18730 [Mucilaginibacter sp. PAMC 26640]|nr:hypothetical protein A0256_18730 [Mucilaginibacter sp. PAMC 26640]
MSKLITSATSAKAHKLKSILNNPDIVLGDYRELPTFMAEKMGWVKLPNPGSASYQHEMLTFCMDTGVEDLYVLGAEEMHLLAESFQLFKEYYINIIDARTNV